MPPNLLLFFGAGASKPLGIPINREFYDDFLASRAWATPELGDFPVEFHVFAKAMLGAYGPVTFDLEAIMTILTALASGHAREALVSAGKAGVIFAEAVEAQEKEDTYYDDVTRRRATSLLKSIKRYIRYRCQNIDSSKLRSTYDPILSAFSGKGQTGWRVGNRTTTIGGRDEGRGQGPIPTFSCFTTNYDCALEAYFDQRDTTYYRGFKTTGPRKLDPWEIHRGGDDLRIVKLHGSVDMIRLNDGSVEETSLYAEEGKTLRGQAIVEDVLIYPTQEKELFRFPFLDFFYELVQALRNASLWVFLGFSFSDLPILQLLESEARSDKKMIVVSPDALETCKKQLAVVGKRAQVCPVTLRVGDPDIAEGIRAQNSE